VKKLRLAANVIHVKEVCLVVEEFRGYSASKRRYFYGIRMQVIVTVEGLPVECCILPGNLSDIQGLAELPLSLPVAQK